MTLAQQISSMFGYRLPAQTVEEILGALEDAYNTGSDEPLNALPYWTHRRYLPLIHGIVREQGLVPPSEIVQEEGGESA